MKNFLKISIVLILVLVTDLVTKHFLSNIEYLNIIPNVISFATNNGNDGVAFGLFSGERVWIILISSILIAALLIFNHFVKNKNTFYCFGFGFVLGGAIGNLVDRIWLGTVRDFIYLDFFKIFPIFNFADTFICIGAFMLAIFILFSGKGEKKSK